MARHLVSLGLWRLDAAASEADVQAHLTAIESRSDDRVWAMYQHHRYSAMQQKNNANIIVDVDRRPIFDVAEELQAHVQQTLLSSKLSLIHTPSPRDRTRSRMPSPA